MTPSSRVRRCGAALITAIVALVVIGLIASIVGSMSLAHGTQSKDRTRSVQALALAEAGIAHSVGLFRGPLANVSRTRVLLGNDSLPNTADDGVLTGMGILTADEIPTSGVALTTGSYFVQILDDPGDPAAGPLLDGNGRLLARCTGTTPDGAVATVDAIVGSLSLPAIAFNGNGNLSGNPTLQGACGGAHANANLLLSGTTTASSTVSATGTISGGGTVITDGSPVTPTSGAPAVTIPSLTIASSCGSGVLTLSAAGIATFGASSYDANSAHRYGWRRTSSSPVKWEFDPHASSTPAHIPGARVCVSGNVYISSNVGSVASPYPISIFSTGSIEISGNPYLAPDASGWLMLAEGDVSISGNMASTPAFAGLIYARAQCKVSGNPGVAAQLLCFNEADGAGDINLTDENLISGNPTFTYNCNSPVGGPMRVQTWSRRF